MAATTDTRSRSNASPSDDDEKHIERSLTAVLLPYEPLITHIQSLLVWICPWRSAVLFAVIHLLLWYICTTSSRFFFLVSVTILAIIILDTWRNRIWPEIRVPPTDKDGWTFLHPHLLSVPEISSHISHALCSVKRSFKKIKAYRRSHPLIFCLGSTSFFTTTAFIGHYISGYMLAYLTIMSLMLWPCVLYHSLMRNLYLKLEPTFMWLDYKLRNTCLTVATLGGRISLGQAAAGDGPHIEVVNHDEDFVPQIDSDVVAALAKAITDSEEEGANSAIATPRLSKNPSVNNTDDEDDNGNAVPDFELDVNQMPSFDDLDNTDDDLDLPSVETPSSCSRLSTLRSSANVTPHFGDTDSEDELAKGLDFNNSSSNKAGSAATSTRNSGAKASSSAAQANVESASSSATQALSGLSSIAGAMVARTLSTMVESAMQGVATLSQGQTASASSMIPRTGARLVYTRSMEGESIDFSSPEPTIIESEEDAEYEGDNDDDEDDEGRGRASGAHKPGPRDDMGDEDEMDSSEQIAEIEKDFDFLRDLDSDSETR